MAQLGQNMAPNGAGASGGPGNRTPARVPVFEIDNVRSYMFEVEAKEVLHIDRLGAADVVETLEKMAVGDRAWVCTDGDVLIIKLSNHWRVKVMRDATVIKAGDYVLVADDKFLLLAADRDGRYIPLAKGNEITWDGTEEFFTPSDIRRLAKDVARRILEQTHWL